MIKRHLANITAAVLLASLGCIPPLDEAARPVPEREVLSLASDLTSLAGRRGFDAVALERALDEGSSADVCRALALAPADCEWLGTRVYVMGRRLHDADGHVIGEASRPPDQCTVDYRPCVVLAIMSAQTSSRFPVPIAGAAVIGALRCRCAHCPGGRLARDCDATPGR